MLSSKEKGLRFRENFQILLSPRIGKRASFPVIGLQFALKQQKMQELQMNTIHLLGDGGNAQR